MRLTLRTGGLAFALTAAIAPLPAAAAQTSSAAPKAVFTYELHGIAQFDAASYMQTADAASLPVGGHLSDGYAWRRLRASVAGTVFNDWSYTFELQGNTSGTVSPIAVRQAYIEYDGRSPLAIRAGQWAVSTGMEGSSSASSSMLLERAAPSTLQRFMGGGPTMAMGLFYATRDLFMTVAVSSSPIADTPMDIDRHSAVAARAADVVYRDSDSVVALDVNSAAILRVADSPPGASMHKLQLNGDTELAVNATHLITTGTLDADNAWSWALESAGTWRNFFAEAGYFRFGVNRRQVLSDFGRNYQGYFLGASWVLTGEQRRWSSGSGAFAGPVPNRKLGEDGFGAFELALRYSDVDLNDHEGEIGMALPLGGARGGDQHILGLGLNWTPTELFRFVLQAQNIRIQRIGALGANPNVDIGQNYWTLALRSQISF